jgi:hypothetical protein
MMFRFMHQHMAAPLTSTPASTWCSVANLTLLNGASPRQRLIRFPTSAMMHCAAANLVRYYRLGVGTRTFREMDIALPRAGVRLCLR